MTKQLDILEKGLALWRVDPQFVTARRIANELGVVHGSVLYYFRNSQITLRDAIAFHAVEQGDSRVIASLVAMRHPAVNGLTDDQRREHMQIAADAVRV